MYLFLTYIEIILRKELMTMETGLEEFEDVTVKTTLFEYLHLRRNNRIQFHSILYVYRARLMII